ncbi:MAG: hypothetical protein DRG33_06035 [Deltaproteobacteria bacterium]|nr:MAG: hypothetical protein DRG33_06035 [Deltaproteobacteria bacterium]
MDYRILIPIVVVAIIIFIGFVIGVGLTYQPKDNDYYKRAWYTPCPDWSEYLKLLRARIPESERKAIRKKPDETREEKSVKLED